MSLEFMPDHEKAALAFVHAVEKDIKDNFPDIAVAADNITDILLNISAEMANKHKGTEKENFAIMIGNEIDIESANEIYVLILMTGNDGEQLEKAGDEADEIAKKYNGEFVDTSSHEEIENGNIINASLYVFS